MKPAHPILPGATLGVFGGGQLGRMFVMAAARMGYRTLVFSPEKDSPAGQVACEQITAEYEDESAIRDFAARCAAITIEFENIPARTLELASSITITRPGPDVLAIAQDRLRERAFLDRFGFPCAPHAIARSAAEAEQAVAGLGAPVVLKSARFGYDGRGQARVDRAADVGAAWNSLSADEVLCEGWVNYQCELSVLVSRSATGQIELFGPIENRHANHILDLSVVPAAVPAATARDATELARAIATALDLVGVICVEMFLTTSGDLLVNELAPRPHNSGHLTIEAAAHSQFEQQVRALCALPLAPMTLKSPAAMANLLGDLWRTGEPRWDRVFAEPSVSLHLYGKDGAAPGRKMGHITALGSSPQLARRRALAARDGLLAEPAASVAAGTPRDGRSVTTASCGIGRH
ncbi:MAG: 5-(carboxyamino)imidazole ribonucleotide synthase [Phycisphaerales bacterium JB039]